MQTILRAVAVLMGVQLLAGATCIKEIPSEERLDRDTRSAAAQGSPGISELAKVVCQDSAPGLAAARAESKNETDRLNAYQALYDSLLKRANTLEEAMARNPDLAFTEGSEQLVANKERCIEETADVKVEFERFVREVVEVPTLQEVKGGRAITVARMDFRALRAALDTLAPDDKATLLEKLETAEGKLGTRDARRRK